MADIKMINRIHPDPYLAPTLSHPFSSHSLFKIVTVDIELDEKLWIKTYMVWQKQLQNHGSGTQIHPRVDQQLKICLRLTQMILSPNQAFLDTEMSSLTLAEALFDNTVSYIHALSQ